jgi:hypothetical protein
MTDRSLRLSIAAMLLCSVSIVAGAWIAHLVPPQQVAPQTSTLTV